MTITVFIPCFMDVTAPQAGLAMVQVLEKLGHHVTFAANAVCCGQPPFNSGYWDHARDIARPVLKALADAEAIVIPSGSCGAMLKKFYLELFAGHPEQKHAADLAPRVHEFTSFLVDHLGVTDVGARFPHKVTYHDGCHGLRELGLQTQARTLLQHVRDLELIELADNQTCCGFGGTFATKHASISTAMGEVKCNAALQTGADYLISADSSCLLHLQGLLTQQQKPLPTLHLAQVLASQ
jgi:L-lactate dehydrogenase complex protein LldE